MITIHDLSEIFKTSYTEEDLYIEYFDNDNWIVEVENYYENIVDVLTYVESCNYTDHKSIIQMQNIIRAFAPIPNIDDCMLEYISTQVGRKIVRETAMPFPPTTNNLDSLGIFTIITPEIFEKAEQETNNCVPPHRDDFVNGQIYLSGGCGTSFYQYNGEELPNLTSVPSGKPETSQDYENYLDKYYTEVYHTDGEPNTFIMFNGQFHHAVDFKRQKERENYRIIQNIYFADVTTQFTQELIHMVDDNDLRWNHIILYEFLNNNIVWRTDDPKIQQEKDNWLKGAPTILPIETYMKYIQGE